MIPRGAIILPSIRWVLHDPKVYADPKRFVPERYLKPRNEPDPGNVVFGYGRIKCPGGLVAYSTFQITVAKILATFTISSGTSKREAVATTQPMVNVKPGITSEVMEFPYEIEPRTTKHAELIMSMVAEDLSSEGDSGLLDRNALQEHLGRAGRQEKR